MRAADLDLIFVPEPGLRDDDHWQTRWSAKLSSARFVGDIFSADDIVETARRATRPIFFIAYSLGAIQLAKAAPDLAGLDVRGAFLVAPPAQDVLDTLDDGLWGSTPRTALPFPSALVASRSDPWATYEESAALAVDWGAALIDAGEAGRLDEASGHGPWPEGLLRLAGMLKKL
jgi:predicted alpha/beta hydrolase family esterase